MASIRSLRPNVCREEAVRHFSGVGILAAARTAISGPLRSIADFYIPFRLFRLEILNGERSEIHLLAVDSVSGMLMPYVFPRIPAGAELVKVESRTRVFVHLSEASSRRIAETRSQRMLFSSGFFRVSKLRISTELVEEFHVPYWVGFRGHGSRASLSVLDAVRRRTEGGKVRQIICNWLISEGDSRLSPISDGAVCATSE